MRRKEKEARKPIGIKVKEGRKVGGAAERGEQEKRRGVTCYQYGCKRGGE